MFYISRFKDIEKREYDCEVVTPMFLGGADPKKVELRAPPIKAAMRFWWRALYNGGDIAKMAEQEAEIFGSTKKKAAVSVNLDIQAVKAVLKDLPTGKMVSVEGKTYKTSIINYLAYGLFEYKNDIKRNVYTKEHIAPPGSIKIIVTFPKSVETAVVNAIRAMITFGGLGARSRNGFGTIHCNALINQAVITEGELKSYTSFSKGTKIFDKFNAWNSWENSLSEIGDVYRNARLKLERRHSWEKRKFIAMPIEAQRENIPEQIRRGRHAKPYFLHVNKTPDGKYRGQILFLPYVYKAASTDKLDRIGEYQEVCNKMNEEIAKGMGGEK